MLNQAIKALQRSSYNYKLQPCNSQTRDGWVKMVSSVQLEGGKDGVRRGEGGGGRLHGQWNGWRRGRGHGEYMHTSFNLSSRERGGGGGGGERLHYIHLVYVFQYTLCGNTLNVH